MKKIILHIPHSSVMIPFYDGYLSNEAQLKQEQLILTDWFTDDLFSNEDTITIMAPFSRLFCDVERFANDSKETMSRVGMGVLYSRYDDGTPLRAMTPELRAMIIKEYYIPHHKKLADAVDGQLKQFGKAIIIDCHSFPDVPLKRDLNQSPNRPDYCIGTDDFHTSDTLVQIAKGFFREQHLTVGINTPYSGSIVPLAYYQKDKRVQSIMLEVNRRLYLLPETNTRSANFFKIKATVKDFVARIVCS
jgi:N-formylglutamate amidohydrolase